MTGSASGDELRAAVAARRDLGPDFEDALIESFLEQMGAEVDRRVDERVAAVNPRELHKADKSADGMRLALAIVSMSLGTIATIALVIGEVRGLSLLIVWGAIVLVNIAFAQGGRRPR